MKGTCHRKDRESANEKGAYEEKNRDACDIYEMRTT